MRLAAVSSFVTVSSLVVVAHGHGLARSFALVVPPPSSSHRSTQIPVDDDDRYWNLKRLYVSRHRINTSTGSGGGVATPRLAAGVRVPLSPDQAHYLTKVLRLFGKQSRRQKRKDDEDDVERTDNANCVRIYDGVSGEWLARVVDVQLETEKSSPNRRQKQTKDATLVAECVKLLRDQGGQDDYDWIAGKCESSPRPWVLFAPIKKQRAKLMVEKCTELGAGAFVTILTDRTDQTAVAGCFNGDNQNKLRLQALEASEQSERLSIPIIANNIEELTLRGGTNETNKDKHEEHDPSTLPDFLKKWCSDTAIRDSRMLLICTERGTGGAVPVLCALQNTTAARVAFLIGPEGGWSPTESASFRSLPPNLVRCVSLGSSVLRAETAAMMAVGAWALHDAK